jgi:hypothetical protein
MAELLPASEVKKYDPNRYEFRWNEDFTAAEVIPLRWFDNVSYIKYQGDFE